MSDSIRQSEGKRLNADEPNDVDRLAAQLSGNDWTDPDLLQEDRDFDVVAARQVLLRFNIYPKDSRDVYTFIVHPE